MKLLTVTVPCYNSQDYMEKCIESLLRGGERVEIIVIKDGSKDVPARSATAMPPSIPTSSRSSTRRTAATVPASTPV